LVSPGEALRASTRATTEVEFELALLLEPLR